MESSRSSMPESAKSQTRDGTTFPPETAQAHVDPMTRPTATFLRIQFGCVDGSSLIMLVGGEVD